MADKLTIKQDKFAQGLFAGLSQREAYKQAYDAENMSDKCIDEEACILAANPKVSQRIGELNSELKLRNMVTVERILAEYAKLGFSEVTDFLQVKTERVLVDTDRETGEPVSEIKQIVMLEDTDNIPKEKLAAISEIKQAKDGSISFKLHDKKGALDSMAKTLGMLVEKTESTIKVSYEDILSEVED